MTTVEGQTVFPVAARILSRSRELGPQHSITVRRLDGTTFALSGVLWSDRDATSLVVGDRLAEWTADPQGHAVSTQYLRDRASRPR